MSAETIGHLFVAVVVGMMGWIGTSLTQRYNDLRRRVERLENIEMGSPGRPGGES